MQCLRGALPRVGRDLGRASSVASTSSCSSARPLTARHVPNGENLGSGLRGKTSSENRAIGGAAGHRRIELVFLSVGEPCRTAAARPRPVCVARLTGFLGPDGAFSSTRGSLRHPALVDVPSVQPVSALATRLRGWRSCGPEFRRTGRQSHGFENLLDGVLGLDHSDEAERGFAARADGVDLKRPF